MPFLIMSLSVSVTLLATMKVVTVKKLDAFNIIFVNYVIGVFVSLLLCISQGKLRAYSVLAQLDISSLFVEKSAASAMCAAIVLGIGIGLLYVANILLINTNIKNNGAGVSTLFLRSGFLITIAVSIFFFSERATTIVLLAVALTITALIIAGGIGKSTSLVKPVFLVCILIGSGLVESGHVAFGKFSTQDYLVNFTLVVFTTSLIFFSIIFFCMRRKTGHVPFRKQEVLFGAIIGTLNAFTNLLQILALRTVPASIMFPTLTAGSLVLITIISLAFKENLGARKLTAIGLCVCSIILVNMQR